MKYPSLKIEGRTTGEGYPCFIIAEAGINHNGSLAIAKKMIDVAKKAGVDAIKFQTFKAKELVNNEKETYEYETQGKKVKESQLKMFERCELQEKDWKIISLYCKKKGIIFFSTPQNVSDLKILLRVGVPAIKVGSDDLVNLPLQEAYAKEGLPMIISTGMAYLSEVDETVRAIQKYNTQLAILHCISTYPASFNELNLRRIETLQQAFPRCVIGFSDHSWGIIAACTAVVLGAHIIEKHFTLDRNMYGPDQRFSADPKELEELVKAIRNVELSLGSSEVKPVQSEMLSRKLFQRSIVASQVIAKGERFTNENLSVKRPGTGLRAQFMGFIVGREAKKHIAKGDLITFSDVG